MRLMVIDGSNVVMHCALGGEIAPAQAAETATGMIWRAAGWQGATHLIVTFDSPEVPSWRKVAFPDYKANRETDTTPWLMAGHAACLRKGWAVEAIGGYEADDLIATIATRAASRAAVLVVSGDSDVLPLTVHESVTIVKPKNGGAFTLLKSAEVCAKYDVAAPGQLVDLKAMTGETGDNVPGVPGIGAVRAGRLLRNHGTLDAVIEAGKAGGCIHSKKVAQYEETVRLARRLVLLDCAAPIPPIVPSECQIQRQRDAGPIF